MNQALLSIEDEVTAVSDSAWDVKSDTVPIEKFRIEAPPALLFFWDGKKVHRITDERLKKEMSRMLDYSF